MTKRDKNVITFTVMTAILMNAGAYAYMNQGASKKEVVKRAVASDWIVTDEAIVELPTDTCDNEPWHPYEPWKPHNKSCTDIDVLEDNRSSAFPNDKTVKLRYRIFEKSK